MFEILIIIRKSERKGRNIVHTEMEYVPFSIINNFDNKHRHYVTDQHGTITVPLDDGLYYILIDREENFVETKKPLHVPLAHNEKMVEIFLPSLQKQRTDLKRRLLYSINKGDEKNLNRAVQLLTQIKDAYPSYYEIPEFRTIPTWEVILENKLFYSNSEGRFASNEAG